MKFACLLSNGFEDMEALATVDLLRRAKIEIDLVAIYDELVVTGAYGTSVVSDKLMKDVDVSNYDGLFIPGGGHSFKIRDEESVIDFVGEFYSQEKWLMAICAAPTVFGKMGIMDGLKYTSFPGTENDMGKAIRVDAKAIRDNQFITARSVGVVYEFVFEILKAVYDDETVKRLKEMIVY